MLNAAYRLARAYAVCIVGVGVGVVALELSALFPSERVTEIACRVALCIVGDRLTVVCGEQVLPSAVVGV